MPVFRYTAIDRAGALVEGDMEAADAASVIARLKRDGAMPMRAIPARAGWLAGAWRSGGALRPDEIAEVTRELSIMLGAGQDIDRALLFLVETAASRRVRAVIASVRDAVRDGSPLSAAIARHPASFSRLYIGLVQAGEAGGRLAETLTHLADMLERQRRLAATVQSALIYPILLLVAAIGSIVLMLTQVLPQFVPLFEQSGAQLPRSTQWLIAAGDAIGNYGALAFLVVLVVGLAIRLALRQPSLRLGADRLALRLPLFGGLLRDVLAARFTRTLGTLVANGVALLPALSVVRDVMLNQAAVAAVDAARTSAQMGGGLAAALTQAGIFPVRTGYLLRLGEENAQLAAMALRAADIHEEATRLSVQRLLALMVPLITVVMGAAVAGIVASLVLAMLGLNDLAQ